MSYSDEQLLAAYVAACNKECELLDAELGPILIRKGVAAAMRESLGIGKSRLVELSPRPEKVKLLADYKGPFGLPDLKKGDVVEFPYKTAYESYCWYGLRDGKAVAVPAFAEVEVVA